MTITLDRQLLAKLQACACSAATDVCVYVKTILEQHVRDEQNAPDRTWMPKQRWDQLVQGISCPICNHLQSAPGSDTDSYKVADLAISQVDLIKNQFVPGYSVLYCHKHIREPYELPPAEQLSFFTDLMRVGRALEKVFRPIKMNFEILGNATPHLHCHIKPRYYGDAAPGIPIDPNLQTIYLTEEQYLRAVQSIRTAL